MSYNIMLAVDTSTLTGLFIIFKDIALYSLLLGEFLSQTTIVFCQSFSV